MPDLSRTNDRVDWGRPVNWGSPLNRGLVSWWLAVPGRMGWATPVMRDLCLRNNGTLTNMAFPGTSTSGWGTTTRPGGFGEWRFDGADDVVTANNSRLLLTSGGGLTICGWMLQTSFAESGTVGAVYASYPSNIQYTVRVVSSGKLQGYLRTSDGDFFPQATAATSLNTWNHYAVVYNDAAKTIRLYVNGVEVSPSPGSYTGTPATPATTVFTIGRAEYSAADHLTGAVDDIRGYNRALSAAEIAAIPADSQTSYRRTLNWYQSRAYASQAAATGNRRRRYLTLGVA